MKGCIYTLIDPSTNLVRYVGQTIVNPNKRYSQHIYQWKRSVNLTHLNNWIKQLFNNNLKPILNIVEDNIDDVDLDSKEIQYIKIFKSIGANLCNHTTGGSGIKSFKMTEVSKLKRIRSLKTSESWRERNIRHSQIMKDLHSTNLISFGYGKLEKAERLQIGNKIQENNPRRRYIKIKNINTNEILEFDTVKNMKLFFNCNLGTVRDFIFGIRNSKFFKNYTVLENHSKIIAL